jgi:ribosomal protein S9
MEKSTYFSGTGRRKTSTAQIKLTPGNGTIIINGFPYEELFSRVQHRQAIIQPFVVTENTGKYNVVVNVAGGGLTGQSGPWHCPGLAGNGPEPEIEVAPKRPADTRPPG